MDNRWTIGMYLTMFGEGGGAAGSGDGGADGEGPAQEAAEQPAEEAPKEEQPEQKQEQKPQDKGKAFRELIRGEYKTEFETMMRENLQRRFKDMDSLKAQVDGAKPIMELLAGKYGVADASDMAAILKAAEEDDGYYEEEAAEKGLSVEQLKQFKRMERENAQLKAAAEERQRIEQAAQIQARWAQEEQQLKQIIPGFSLEAEAQNPQFAGLLRAGVQMQAAYYACHADEMMSGAMQYASQQAQRATVENVRARGMRPDEAAMGKGGAAQTHKDVGAMTRAEREELIRRAQHGEVIEL